MIPKTYRQAFAFLVICLTLYSSSVLFAGNVIYPHSNNLELGIDETDSYTVNRKFSDLNRLYIPAIYQSVADTNHAWIATWTSNVQFGRPLDPLWFSKSNIITHSLSFFTSNPLRLATLQAIFLVWLGAFFVFGFFQQLALHPIACLIMAIGVATGSHYAYWTMFSPFLATYTWVWGLLWIIVIFVRKPTWTAGIGLAFFVYNLLLLGYPQNIIGVAYPVIAFTLLRIWRSSHNRQKKVLIAICLGVAVLAGVFASLPVYLDVYYRTVESPRATAPDSFFTAIIPQFADIVDVGVFLQLVFDPFWFGNPIQPEFVSRFDGIAFTPLYAFFFFLSWFSSERRDLWLWHLFFILMLVANMLPDVYLVMVHYLGFNLSRYFPLYAGVMMMFIPIGITLDHLLKGNYRPSNRVIIGFVVCMVLSLGGLSYVGKELHFQYVILSFLLIFIAIGFVKTHRISLPISAALLSMLFYGHSMLLTRPPDSIYQTSSLVERIRAETPQGERYAWMGSDSNLLIPNMAINLDINTIHSYDSLVSERFQNMMTTLGGQPGTAFGRVYNYLELEDVVSNPIFSYTGIGVLLSLRPLDNPQLDLLDRIGDVYMYRLHVPPILVAQLTDYVVTDGQVILSDRLPDYSQLSVKRTANFDDFNEYELAKSDSPTLLFISQQYNRFWKAYNGKQALETVLVNDFYLGVVVPPETTTLTLRFRPYSYWAWIPQVVFLLLGIGISVATLIQCKFDRNLRRKK